jgi:hypothetical protein
MIHDNVSPGITILLLHVRASVMAAAPRGVTAQDGKDPVR